MSGLGASWTRRAKTRTMQRRNVRGKDIDHNTDSIITIRTKDSVLQCVHTYANICMHDLSHIGD